MLGTGSAFAKNYFNTNALFYTDNKTVMLDCGTTASRSLNQLGKTFNHIDALLISHIHADHIGGMEEFAFQMKFVYNRKPLLYIPEPIAETLWENSLKGGLMQDGLGSLEDYFDVRLIAPGAPAELLPAFTVEPVRTQHIPGKPSFSYIINNSFFYSADMRFDRELLEELVERGCETIFHECQFSPPGIVHTTLDELLSLPRSIQERVWLMHYDDAKPEYEQAIGPMRFVEQHQMYSFNRKTAR
ncbi:MBL fold metallo-hydrolase [Paenibacillus sp. sptzw28]|uniref:MBL fold metallo-hydrolase n=1 Tax=Paenibacillus sp. sptzw28 TaxID=715179 RepID=UPI001C6E67D0|nr:MBL fold metallo-hydrolase [Paenibacillus sp. sptzw28]